MWCASAGIAERTGVSRLCARNGIRCLAISSTRARLLRFVMPRSAQTKYQRFFPSQGREIRISSIGVVEVQSAFAMKVRAGVIDSRLAGQQRAALMLDIASGGIEVYNVNENHFKHAERLIGKYSTGRRLRTLDAFQLAVALDLLSQRPSRLFRRCRPATRGDCGFRRSVCN